MSAKSPKPDKPKFTPAMALADALSACNGKVPVGMRAYRVETPNEDVFFVVSNSPAQAALSVCAVRTCSNKEAMDAVLEAFSKKG